jgi:hypothetical protein
LGSGIEVGEYYGQVWYYIYSIAVEIVVKDCGGGGETHMLWKLGLVGVWHSWQGLPLSRPVCLFPSPSFVLGYAHYFGSVSGGLLRVGNNWIGWGRGSYAMIVSSSSVVVC